MAKSLVIVESPAKARTIAKYLGKGYEVEATMGHIRDLPGNELGVDLENNFKPTYKVLSSRRKIVSQLKKRAAGAAKVFLAPDLDREGEAIAWHVKQALRIKDERAFRVTFNEITKNAIRAAFEHPGKISMDKVDAQQARRLLDRLVGYQISPLLWKRIPNVLSNGDGKRRSLSAGRVQSVAVRLIVEREREIEAFEPEEFWRITAVLAKDSEQFEAELELKAGEKLKVADGETAGRIVADLNESAFVVQSVESKETKSNPSSPFTTSTLQQAAATVLRFPAKKTMRLAQQLYEGVDLGEEGPTALITYMRTDSVRMSTEAVSAARRHIRENFGKEYLPSKPRSYRSKKSAQEAHEAVRPTYMERTPESLADFLSDDQRKLYELIWRRALASQMVSARFNVTTANIAAGPYGLVAKGRVVLFPGHTVLSTSATEEALLPDLKAGDEPSLVEIKSEQKFTQPPSRYTEAALVRTLEKEGIGRPSTYATIISTIQERSYVLQRKRVFHPTALGVFVTDKLVRHFPRILDLKFTSHMEQEFDQIESGEIGWTKVLSEFYGAFAENLKAADEEMAPFEETDQTCPDCSKPLVKRLSRAGMFLACSGYPDCKYTRNLSATGKDTGDDLEGKACPKCGKALVLRGGPRGPFVGCTGYPECDYTASVEDPEGGLAEEPKEGKEVKQTDEERECPDCGKPLVVRNGKRGSFWGCSGFPKCKHTESLEKDDETAAEPAKSAADKADKKSPARKCPNCGKDLVIRRGPRGSFLACPGYPDCKHTEPIRKDAAPKSAPKKTGDKCPDCGKDLVYRRGKRGTFIGCSGFPKCRYTASSDSPS
ncbi:MAG: type I DNA topoisomerase [Planctomycetota bacterium]|jgi:DNA topoisomerase-1